MKISFQQETTKESMEFDVRDEGEKPFSEIYQRFLELIASDEALT